MVSCGAWVPVGHRLGLWTPIAERSALLPAAVLAVLAAATLLPARRLLRWAGQLLEQTNGEVLVAYVITVGAAVAVAFLIVVR
jgi:hypothetical protein